MTLAFHPLADIFPLVVGGDFDALVEDIREHGLREPIVLLDKQIVDGRNRFRALQHLTETGEVLGDGWGHRRGEMLTPSALEPPQLWFNAYNRAVDGDPLSWVISKNLKRRHLNESQRAMVAARLATLQHGGARRSSDQVANLPLEAGGSAVHGLRQKDAAETLNVSKRLVVSAKVVQEHATPELKHAVDQGKLAVSAAAQAARLPEETQRRIAEEADAGRANVVRTVIKKEKRASREAQLAERQRALPQKKYGVIVADPEWRFEPYSRDTGMDRAPDNHYPTSDTLDIIARPVGAIAADDAVLWLWATAPMLQQALAVMKGWGFDYKSHIIWRKLRPGAARGAGYWFTGEHELLLVGTRGSLPAPATALCGSVIDAPVGEHSAKPEEFLALIERAFPNLPKIELNRRGSPRPGWDAWGNEAETPEGASIVSRETVDEEEADRIRWKALSALDARVSIDGPILGELLAGELIERVAEHPGYRLTPRGLSTLGMLDNHFSPPPQDVESAPRAAAMNSEIPGEGASGTAREASSTGCGTPAATSDVGVQPAPPHVFAPLADKCCERDTWPIGATVPLPDDFRLGCPATRAAGDAVATVHPDDGLSIPAFLRRGADNKLSSTGDNNASDHRRPA